MTSAADTARGGRTVRVRTEVAALTRTFDYSVPGGWTADHVIAGSRVRVPLHGRTVRGWVVGDDGEAPAGVEVVPLKSWLGWGPPPALVRLAEWAAWRWAGPMSFFLNSASPSTVVRDLPTPPARGTRSPSTEPRTGRGRGRERRSGRTAVGAGGSWIGDRRPAPTRDRPHRSGARRGDRPGRRRPSGRCAGAGPLDGMGRAPGGTAAAPGARRHDHVGRSTRRVAGGGRDADRRLGPAAHARRRVGARCARSRLPGGERADLQRGRRRGRAGAP